ncbi:MAG: bacteriohemerythrin [Bacteroidales bacterium]|jgi:hemerythrin-like metal-binding protein|nr:bacteriohemerythrin [Bacteroidales bacterium]MDY0198858.1 bacteriohemerythrin [Tenuifilaceae bacterium]
MSFLMWQSKYETGIESVDNDHRRLVSMIEDLYSAMSKGEAKEVINDIVKGLTDYAVVHFNREEELMESIGFADLEDHREIHQGFAKKVNSFQEMLASGQQNISVEVVAFLRDWLINHIQKTDMQFVKPYNERGTR